MNAVIKVIPLVAYLMVSIITPTIGMAKPMYIIVDPGHGGHDHGAVREGIREADVTLAVSKHLYERLKSDKQFKTTITRTKNSTLSLHDRSDLAKQEKADIFLSIHANTTWDTSAKGAEFYFQDTMPADEESLFLANRENYMTHKEMLKGSKFKEAQPKSEIKAIIKDLKRSSYIYNSQILSEVMQEVWKKHYKVRRRPIKQGPFHVLVNVPMPSVLIELGFLSNKKERKWLTNKKTQKKLADIIYKGLKVYKNRVDKSNFKRHIIPHAKR